MRPSLAAGAGGINGPSTEQLRGGVRVAGGVCQIPPVSLLAASFYYVAPPPAYPGAAYLAKLQSWRGLP